MRLIFHAAMVCSLGLSPMSVAAEAPRPLEPTRPWNVDYADNECRLVRTFGTGDASITLRLARGGSIDTFDMVLAGLSVPKLPQRLDITMKLEPQGETRSIQGYSLAVPKQPQRFIRWFDADADLINHFNRDQVVAFSANGGFAVRLNLTEGRAAIAALNTCYDDLLKTWGIDLAKLHAAKVSAKPVGNPGSWATNEVYPTEALRAELSGEVPFQIIIGSDGKPISCKVIHSSGVPVLDQTTCDLVLRRARFTPALDDHDQPMASYYVNRVRWVIPN